MTIKRLTWLIAMLIAMVSTASAESEAIAEASAEVEEMEATTADKASVEVPAWVKNIKFSGYGMLQYQGIDKDGAEESAFNLRLLRLILDGKIGDFDWRVQAQGSSNAGPGNATFNLVDLYAEWVKHKEFRVKVGQFKRAFSYENPTHPITQGWYSYAMVINNLVGFGDRTGEKSSGGRDIGIQAQGDIIKNAAGRPLLHYQVGIYNGEGINKKDVNTQKDLIGGFWVMPVKGLRIGAFGWTGSKNITYTYNQVYSIPDVYAIPELYIYYPIPTPTYDVTKRVKKNRYAISAEWDKDEYTFRTEYIHSQGYGANEALGDKADGWYVFGIVPVIKSKLHAKARYQTYRDNKEWNRAKTMYEAGLNYFFHKNLQLNFEYARVNDRTIANPDKHSYNFVDLELDFRF